MNAEYCTVKLVLSNVLESTVLYSWVNSVDIVTRVRVGRSGVRIPTGCRRILSPPKYPGGLQGPPTPLLMEIGFYFLESSGQGVMLTTHYRLALRLRVSGAKPLFPLCTFMTCTGTKLPFT